MCICVYIGTGLEVGSEIWLLCNDGSEFGQEDWKLGPCLFYLVYFRIEM